MELIDLDPHERSIAYGTVKRVLEADGLPMGGRSAALLEVVGRALEPLDAESIEAPSARRLHSPAHRRALTGVLVIAACIEGQVTVARQKVVESIALELGERTLWVRLLDALRRGRVFTVKRALMRHSPDARRLFARLWNEEGVLGILRAVVFVLGLSRDAKLAARYRALSTCPPESFGSAVAAHFEARSLAFPGEKGGMPERMIHHDLMHVLNGYDTDPAGECELAGFYAGCADGDAFTFIVTVLATFHLGLGVSPAAVQPARFAFDPARVFAAYLRGRQQRVDIMGPWDYWSLMPLPMAEVRTRLFG